MTCVARKRNTGSLSFDFSSIDLKDIRSTGFDINKNVEDAKKSLEDYDDYRVEKIRVNFDDTEWFFKELYSRNRISFNYTEFLSLIRFSNIEDKDELFIAIKCWIVKEINESSITVTQNKLLNLHSAFLSTNSLWSTDELLKMIHESNIIRKDNTNKYRTTKVSSNVMYKFITDLVDFLEFYNRDKFVDFINDLSELKNKFKLERTYRKLASFKDVIIIGNTLEHWFEEATKNDSEELLKYYPLMLWWNLTSIIPMRIVEFLHIKRECISFKDGYYFITFPRMKYHRIGEHRTDMKYDTLPIPIDLYNHFNTYARLSDYYGESEFLISHKVYRHFFNYNKNTKSKNQMFNYSDLHYTLASFFKNVLHQRYKINISSVNRSYRAIYNIKSDEDAKLISNSPNGSIETMINPGDLRHLAIINMMMQGYDKVEIQRLAGHFTEDTQYSYFNHMENWMDIEIQKMEKEFSQYRPQNSTFNQNETLLLHPNIQDFFENQSKKNYINNSSHEKKQEDYLKLDLGSCMDETMPCPSFNWKHRGCYFCEHWSITSQELEEKRNHLVSDLNLLYEETKGKIKFIQSLFASQLDNSENVNNSTKQDLSSTSQEIQLDIKRIAKLRSMLGVLDNE